MSAPVITVIVPTYNRADSLADTLSALTSQTYSNYEVIVVDDGSTDQTHLAVLQFANVRYLYQNNSGPAAARNAGAREGRGAYFAFTDDDCVPPHDWLERIAGHFRHNSEIAGVGGPCRAPADLFADNAYARYEWAYERGMLPSARYIRWLTYGNLDWRGYWPGRGDYVGCMDCPAGRSNNVCYRREVYDALHGFDESFPLAAAEDADFKIRLCIAGHQLYWDDDLLIEHHHAYSARRFRRQHFTYGRGVVQLERKYRGKPTPRWRALLRVGKRLLALPRLVVSDYDVQVSLLKALADLFDALGQLRA